MRILILFLFASLSVAQSLDFYGEAKQGSLIFGVGENIKKIIYDEKPIDFYKDIFVIGFDRNDTLKHTLIVEMKGKTYIKKILPQKGDFKIQRINRINQKYVTPPKDVMNRIVKEREKTQLAKAKIGNVKEAMFKTGFIIPIKAGRISGVFGSQRILNGIPKNVHNGMDIAVPRGYPVKAMADGKVIFSADNFYYAGNFIIIDHGLGLNSMYLHLSKSLVKEGDWVKKGDIIGKVGTTGRSTGPHLHWAVQWFDKRVDPKSIFSFQSDEKYRSNR